MIGFTSVSLRPYTVEEVVRIAAEAGAEIIEWGTDKHIKTVRDAENAKKLCDEYSLPVNSVGSYYRTGSGDKAAWKTVCECAHILGAKTIRAWLGVKGSDQTSPEEYETLLQDARSMADEAAKYGLIVSHECHHDTYNDETEASLRFLRDVGRDNVKTYYQSWYRDEAGDRDKLEKTFPFVTDVHLSFSELKKFQEGYTRDEDYIEKILSWLKEFGYDRSLIIEFTASDSPEELKKDIARLKALWAVVSCQ